MNYVLSVYANRVTGVNNVELSCGGVIEKSYTGKFSGTNIKENVLTCIHRGLRLAATCVSHKDRLYLEVQNRHLVDWLMGRKEYKGYDNLLDTVFDDIEQLDCQYKYLFEPAPRAKKGTVKKEKVVVEPPTIGIEAMMEEFEG